MLLLSLKTLSALPHHHPAGHADGTLSFASEDHSGLFGKVTQPPNKCTNGRIKSDV